MKFKVGDKVRRHSYDNSDASRGIRIGPGDEFVVSGVDQRGWLELEGVPANHKSDCIFFELVKPAPSRPARRRKLDTLLTSKARRAVLVRVLERLDREEWQEADDTDLATVACLVEALQDVASAALDGDRDAFTEALEAVAAMALRDLELQE